VVVIEGGSLRVGEGDGRKTEEVVVEHEPDELTEYHEEEIAGWRRRGNREEGRSIGGIREGRSERASEGDVITMKLMGR